MMEPQTVSTEYIMVIEDSSVDFEIISRAFRKTGWTRPVHHYVDSGKAMDFLQNCIIPGSSSTLPALIMLDLNLYGTGGHEFLAQIKNDENLRSIPVIIMTTSGNATDIRNCYHNGANCYIRKPTMPDDYVRMIGTLKEFWFDWASLPDSGNFTKISSD